jgi:hypothetical protein
VIVGKDNQRVVGDAVANQTVENASDAGVKCLAVLT